MNIHITLVGGQILPVYCGIMHTSPDKVVFICSEKTKEEVARLKAEILCETEVICLDPVDYSSILNGALNLHDKYAINKNQVTVNISGGTKLWSIAFYIIFMKDAEVLYVDQNGYILNLSTNKKQFLNVKLDFDVIFRLNNESVTKCNNVDEYTEEDRHAAHKIERLRNFNRNEFKAIAANLQKDKQQHLKNDNDGKWITEHDSSVIWNKLDNEIDVDVFDNNGELLSENLSSPHVFSLFFNSGWFEYQVADALSKWEYANDVRMNVVFPYKSGLSKNEIDVIVNTGAKLLFVECKTQIFDKTDIDKFNNAVKTYGGIGCKALFITYDKMYEDTKEKCNDNKIITFSVEEYRGKNIWAKLYETLEKELFNINPK